MMKPLAFAVAFALLSAGAAAAQVPDGDFGGRDVRSADDEATAPVRQTTPSRVRENRRERAPEPPTPEEIRAAVSPLAATAAPGCEITEAVLLGGRADGVRLFEIACATGPGFIIEAFADAPKANDCVMLWSFGRLVTESDPAADVGLQCGLPSNQNGVAVIAGYGRSAGLDCQVDDAIANAVDVYEIGCAGRDGWRLEKQADSWKVTTCWQFALVADLPCRFSSSGESAAEWPKLVAGTDAAACQIEGVLWIGDNAQRGSFYELKCASGEGIIVRFLNGAGQQTYSCIDAPQIFNRPCQLTTVAAPATAPAPAGGRA
jgi:hypothetical protein